MFLLFLESTSEIFFILVVALVLFGPRKLPQLSRTIGKSLAEFKRASEEFKRTWEQEVAIETSQKEARIEQAMLPKEESPVMNTIERGSATEYPTDSPDRIVKGIAGTVDPDADLSPSSIHPPTPEMQDSPASKATSKRDWL